MLMSNVIVTVEFYAPLKYCIRKLLIGKLCTYFEINYMNIAQ